MNPNWGLYILLQNQKIILFLINTRLAWHAALQLHHEEATWVPGAMETCFPERLLEHQGTFALYLCTEGRKLGMHHRLNIHVKGGFDLHRPAIQLQDREFDDFLNRAKRKAAVHLKQTRNEDGNDPIKQGGFIVPNKNKLNTKLCRSGKVVPQHRAHPTPPEQRMVLMLIAAGTGCKEVSVLSTAAAHITA